MITIYETQDERTEAMLTNTGQTFALTDTDIEHISRYVAKHCEQIGEMPGIDEDDVIIWEED